MDPVTRLRLLEEKLAATPDSPALLLALARTWRRLHDPRRAGAFVERALALDDRLPGAWNTLGAVRTDLEDWFGAEAAFRNALRIDPATPHAEDNLAQVVGRQTWLVQDAARRGDWRPFDAQGARLLAMHRGLMAQGGAPIVTPFSVLGFRLSPQEQRAAAVAQAERFLAELRLPAPPSRPHPRTDGGRIRVGYLSADFRNNAAGHLLHRMFAAHDRDRFEIYGLSYGPEDGSEFRREIRAGLEHYVELRDLDDATAAERVRSLELDLLVDLMGFAGNHRAGLLARRPARVQVCWLGYCMTTGASWIDGFVADRTALPPELDDAFSERLAFLPDSYQVYSGQDFDRERDRGRHGLPEGMLFACYNMPEKVDPTIWACWMRILAAVPDAHLQVLTPDDASHRAYRERAAAAAIDPARILPAPLLPKRQHLARVAQADLFLDTPLCNAHTTASDALWAGVPVITAPGRLFAQRVGASVCRAAGLPDLVMDDLATYEARATALGLEPGQRERLRAKLDAARPRAPLFDVDRFAASLEDVFAEFLAAGDGDPDGCQTGSC